MFSSCNNRRRGILWPKDMKIDAFHFNRFQMNGGQIEQRRVAGFAEVSLQYRVIYNCILLIYPTDAFFCI